MNKLKLAIGILAIGLIVESALLASMYLSRMPQPSSEPQNVSVLRKSFAIQFDEFNQPISNDTEYTLDSELDGSWSISIQSHLLPPTTNTSKSEAQIAIAPEYPTENLSIPTIIVQERGDGLVRIEYYAQNWNNTYGLILYNSTNPTWTGGENITLDFQSYAPPVQVNPQIAPYPNGNLTITIGNTVVISNYPIAWAGLSDFYVYGLRGSAFEAGEVTITVYEVRSGV